MQALMMERQLLLKRLLWRAERVFGDKQIVARQAGEYHRYTYADYGRRTRQLAQVLGRLGVAPGDRVGTFAWNTHRHFEAYFGVPCMGAVLHTINLRLSPEQITYIINHAGDKVILIDPDQIPALEQIADQLDTVEAYVVLDDHVPAATRLHPVYAYEELLVNEDADLEWPEFDEHTAAAMCYTSGTTGDPKGVVYSHRSIVLHALALCMHGSIGVREDSVFMPATPMFHVNAWGIPYAATVQGTTLVLPGVHPEPEHYLELIERERVTHAVGAVTIGVMMRALLDVAARDYDLSSLEVLWLGGQAPPQGLMRWWRDHHDVDVPQGWGMTEASPLVTFTDVKSKYQSLDEDDLYELKTRQGLPLPLVEIGIFDDDGRELPWDGETVGEYRLRSPWVASTYHDDPRSEQSFADGWFRTGDVGVIDSDGYVKLTDRTKDLVKSGGEWISSVELENALMSHPDVTEAVVIAVPDDKWLERPLACMTVRKAVSADELKMFLADRFAKWWIPEEFLVLDEVPKTSVGKFDKKVLRKRFSNPDDRASWRTVSANEVSR